MVIIIMIIFISMALYLARFETETWDNSERASLSLSLSLSPSLSLFHSISAPLYGYLKLLKATREGKNLKEAFEVEPGNITRD